MSENISSRSANADSTALYVQGLLIFLSAVVGVVGYIIQSKMKAKEREHEQVLAHNAHLKQLKLERVREQMGTFLGPATMHTMQIWNQFWVMRSDEGVLNKLSGGKLQHYYEEVIKFNFKTFLKAEVNEMYSWIGPDLEEHCRNEPKSKFAVSYRNIMTRLVKNNAVPLTQLLRRHGSHLQQWPTSEEFKKRFVCSSKSGWGRNLFFLQFCNWSDEFVDIIDNMWSRNDYTLLFPLFAPYPCQITPYLIMMITTLREMEVKLGTSDRLDVTSHDKEFKNLEAANDKESKKKNKPSGLEEKKNPAEKIIASKYVNGSNKEDSNSSSTAIRVYKKGGLL